MKTQWLESFHQCKACNGQHNLYFREEPSFGDTAEFVCPKTGKKVVAALGEAFEKTSGPSKKTVDPVEAKLIKKKPNRKPRRPK